MKVDIYIHGVPNGQRIWGTGGEDQVINQFYGANGEEQTKYLAEVKKSSGENYCYYSLLKYKNVLAADSRAGSYVGLTIRMDMVCTKVKAVFQILEMVYNNAILGKFVKREGERLKFTVSDFKEKEAQCKAVVDKIMAMLGQSVEGNDFIAITPSMLSGRGTQKVNIAEYSSESALASISQNGSIAVSAEYPSVQFASFIKKKDAETNAIKLQAQQDVSRIQQQASQSLQEQERRCNATILQTREEAQREIAQIREDANREIAQTKAKYIDIEKKLLSYEQKLKQMQKENSSLQNNVSQLQHTVHERDKMIAKLKQGVGNGTDTPDYHVKKPNIMKIIATIIVPFLNLLIVFVVLVVLFLQMPSDNSKKIDQISAEITEIKNSITPRNEVASESKDSNKVDVDTNGEMSSDSQINSVSNNTSLRSDDNNNCNDFSMGNSTLKDLQRRLKQN